MARSFPNDGNHKYLVMDVGAVGTLTDYSLAALISPDVVNRGAAFCLRVAGANRAEIVIDSTTWFGANDFSGIAGSLAPQAVDYQVIGLTHAAGTNVFRWHYWNYTDNGTVLHADGGWASPNPGAIDEIRLGDADNEARGDIAVCAVWNSVLSDADFGSLATDQLADWMALAPTALWADDLETDLTGGGADLLSTVGTVDVGVDPAGFNYSLAPPVVEGSGSAALGAVTATGAGSRLKSGSGSASLGGVSAAGAGVRLKFGSATAALGSLSGAGSGVRSKAAAGVASLGQLAGTGSGTRAKTGSGTALLGGIQGSAHIGAAVIPGHATLTAARPNAGITASRPLATVEAS